MRDVVPGDYLRLKGLWNDPGSGRFIKRGWSTGKAQAIARAAKGSVTRGRLLESGPGPVRIADNRLLRSGLRKGDVVQAGYFDDKYATIRVVTERGERRFFNVRWERLDDSYAPSSVDDPDVDLPNPARYERVRDAAARASDPDMMMQAVAEQARIEYGVWPATALDDPEQAQAFVAAVARAARDTDAFRRSYEAYYEPTGAESVENPLIPPETLLTDIGLLPDWASTDTHADALGAYRLADMISQFHQTPRMGERWSPMENSPVARRLTELNPGFYDFDASQTDRWDGERVAAATQLSPLMQQMIGWFGQPALSTGRFSEPSVLAETQTDVAQMTPENTRMMLADSVWTWSDRSDPDDLPRFDDDPPAYRQGVDTTLSGTLRHEYGHYMDNLYQSAYQMFDPTQSSSKGDQRDAVIAAAEAVATPDGNGDLYMPYWFTGMLSEYSSSSPPEMLAELWAMISHPDYPKWKQAFVASLRADNSKAKFLAVLNAAEIYFNPESDLLVKVGDL
jgi:hypothetical protein